MNQRVVLRTPSLRALRIAAMISASVILLWAPRPIRSQQAKATPDLHLYKVQGNAWALVGAARNITVQVADDGILLVDTGAGTIASDVWAAVRTLSVKPVRWIVNTSMDPDCTGGNEALPRLSSPGPGPRARIIAHENVLNRMSGGLPGDATRPADALLPNDEYYQPTKDFSFNGEAIIVYHVPAAHTDGDSIVHFRRSDVLSTGDIFTPDRYPAIDVKRGGNVQGLIAALNRILEITIPLKYQEAGTYVIPGQGRISDEADVVEYRDMVTIVRDNIQDYITKGMSLDQVKAARPTREYDTEYTSFGGPSADAFIEAVYNSLSQKKP